MTLELWATPHEVMRAVQALQDFGRAHRVPEKPLFELAVALEECGSNIVTHALRNDSRQSFQVMFKHLGTTFSIELRDSGPAFDPTRFVVKGSCADDCRPSGGWGLCLVRRYINVIRYTREGNKNVLCLTKEINEQAIKP